jgi:pseudouridine synthase
VRLQKFLARAGVASRRGSEGLIAAGRVRVDGTVVTAMGSTIDPARQTVEVDGRPVELSPPEWLALHKPPGFLCARTDPRRRPTIYDLVPNQSRTLLHVGRLDYMSEGLLLLTNEGELAHALLHPSARLPRTYAIGLVGPVARTLPERLVSGVQLGDGPARATGSSWRTAPDAGTPELVLTLEEGRNREVRRMCAEVGVVIRWLRREAFGPIALAGLASGRHRELRSSEVEALRHATRAGSRRPGGRE